MIRTFPEINAWTSQAQEMLPGDVAGSGTVANGCGLDLGKCSPPGVLVELARDPSLPSAMRWDTDAIAVGDFDYVLVVQFVAHVLSKLPSQEGADR